MIDGAIKTIIKAASLATVFGLSAKLVFACTIVEGSTIIEDNKFKAQIFVGLSFAAVIALSYLYLLRKRRGLTAVAIGFLIVLLHPALRYGGGGGDCGESYVESAKWLFGLSIICLLFQSAIYVREKEST